jgi:hypothetical protein
MRRGCDDCAVGPGRPLSDERCGERSAWLSAVRFDSPDDRMGHKGRAAGFQHHGPGGFAVRDITNWAFSSRLGSKPPIAFSLLGSVVLIWSKR